MTATEWVLTPENVERGWQPAHIGTRLCPNCPATSAREQR